MPFHRFATFMPPRTMAGADDIRHKTAGLFMVMGNRHG